MMTGIICCLLLSTISADQLSVETPWALSLPAVSKNGAAYLVLQNHAPEAEELIGGETSIAERVELHRHIMQDGLMKMQRVEAIGISGNGSINFEPGGNHLMLMGLRQPLDAGLEFSLTLRFRHVAELSIMVRVMDSIPGSHTSMTSHGHGSDTVQE